MKLGTEEKHKPIMMQNVQIKKDNFWLQSWGKCLHIEDGNLSINEYEYYGPYLQLKYK